MSRTNLKPAASPAVLRTLSRRVILASAVLVPTIAAGAVWLSDSARPAPPPQAASPMAVVPAPPPASEVTTPTESADQRSVGGAVGMVVPEELQTFTVARRLPDGRIVLEYGAGSKAAQGKASASASKGRKTAAKAEPHHR